MPKPRKKPSQTWKTFLTNQANLRVRGVKEIKTVPYVPLSHPFVERFIGTIRRECLDRLLFWTAADLEMKLSGFQSYYNKFRVHGSLGGCDSDRVARIQRSEFRILSLAETLSWFIPNTNGCVNGNSPCTRLFAKVFEAAQSRLMVLVAAMPRCVYIPLIRQLESQELAGIRAATDRHEDVLLAVHHIRHR